MTTAYNKIDRILREKLSDDDYPAYKEELDAICQAKIQRTWVGLTNQEAMDVTRKEGHELLDYIYEYGTGVEGIEERIVAICKAIEAKLKERNT